MKERILQALKQVLMLAAIAGMYVAVRTWGTFTLLHRIPFVAASFDPALVGILESHLWQFLFALAGLTVLSRGNLWSCGINSMNVRMSLGMLLRFYAGAVAVLVIIGLAGGFLRIAYSEFPPADRGLVMVIHWLSSPVADQLLFFGLFQTALLKVWTGRIRIGESEIPSAIFITAVMFALGRIGLPHYISNPLEYAAGYGIGLFSGYVYYRTRSLLAPMLAQAFFFGMPDAVHIIFSLLGYRL
ncbi:MAG: CPBP family intramembrane glutamic endopeptidase [Acidobacteriota bacterium]